MIESLHLLKWSGEVGAVYGLLILSKPRAKVLSKSEGVSLALRMYCFIPKYTYAAQGLEQYRAPHVGENVIIATRCVKVANLYETVRAP